MPRTQLVLPSGQRRSTRLMRIVRAVWRDSSALWREFRVPFLTFIVATIGGGALYGYLHNEVARITPPIPIIHLPYVMIELMVLEQPVDIPEQPYLMIFWYLMPAIAVYAIGTGAVEFVRLFFDRSGRRNAWEEAVASTYRNHIIVIGTGHVGLRVIRSLVSMGFEVVAIDVTISEELDDELSALHVPAIVGDGRLSTTLEKAGLRYAQSLVLCTSEDYVNLQAAMRARELRGDIRIVTRMWDNQFAKQLISNMGVEAVLSASDLAAPSFAGAAVGLEITQTINVQGVDYSMIRLKVEPGSFMEGETIDQLQDKNEMDIVLHERTGEVDVHPEGKIKVNAGDTLIIFARHSQITSIAARNRRRLNPVGD